jgi:hypothetical protein
MIRFKGDVYIAPEQIISIEPGDNGYSQINTVSGVYFVAESQQEVARKVLEWKYIMQKGAYTNTQGMARLRELAGLEEGK